MRRFAFLRRLSFLVALAAISLALPGCVVTSIQAIFSPNLVSQEMDPYYSINIVKTPVWWPDEDTFKTKGRATANLEKSYYETWGKPDYFRIVYNRDRTLIDYETFGAMGANVPNRPELTWIYMERKMEVVFSEREGLKENPLTDEIRTACELGDPDQIVILNDGSGQRRVKYFYRRTGKVYTFVNSQKTLTEQQPPLPGWIRGSSL